MSERFLRLLRLGVTAALAVFVAAAVLTAEPPEQDRAQRIGSIIRCPVCQGEAIADSPAGLAQDMMDLVRQRIAEGYTDQQIVDELLAAYTGSQLLDPPLSLRTAALWAVPVVALALGAWLVLDRRRSRRPPATEPATPAALGAREEA